MPGEVRDLRGERYGRLRILRDAEPRIINGKAHWPAICACGVKLAAVRGTRLTQGRQVSCGCARADPAVRRAARWVTPEKRRREIAKEGAAARWAAID